MPSYIRHPPQRTQAVVAFNKRAAALRQNNAVALRKTQDAAYPVKDAMQAARDASIQLDVQQRYAATRQLKAINQNNAEFWSKTKATQDSALAAGAPTGLSEAHQLGMPGDPNSTHFSTTAEIAAIAYDTEGAPSIAEIGAYLKRYHELQEPERSAFSAAWHKFMSERTKQKLDARPVYGGGPGGATYPVR